MLEFPTVVHDWRAKNRVAFDPKLQEMLFPSRDSLRRFATRTSETRHNKQLHDVAGTCRLDVVRRSVLELVKVFSLLPQDAVDCKAVSGFQHWLTEMSRKLCRSGSPLSARFKAISHGM
ncbi:unnamed protein product [Polarella glacialis]|uniref:Uncharacterized protein n=1 Tax=Polarella glacialis TaxID=89957 RepID=A0A813GHJ5_POLGL|nr:unnamed protein product [Polarella glacialis]